MVPSVRTFVRKLDEKFDHMKNKLIVTLKSVKYVCVTCDVWSSRSQSYLGATIHYLSESYERMSYVLAFRPITGKQSYEILAKMLSNIFNEFEIPIDKITHVVTDGGSAFCKAFRVFGKRDDETEEEIYETIDSDPEDEELNLELPFIRHGNDFFMSNEINFNRSLHAVEFDPLFEEDRDSDESCSNNDISKAESVLLPKQRRCFSHLLNLTPGDFEKELKEGPQYIHPYCD